jgi:hypothetical protein
MAPDFVFFFIETVEQFCLSAISTVNLKLGSFWIVDIISIGDRESMIFCVNQTFPPISLMPDH